MALIQMIDRLDGQLDGMQGDKSMVNDWEGFTFADGAWTQDSQT